MLKEAIELQQNAVLKLVELIEERDELLRQNKEIEEELAYIKKTTTKQMYINDLDKLYSELEKDFK